MNLEEIKSNEMALVGSVLFLPNVLDGLSGINGLQFMDRELGQVFDLARDLRDRGEAIDANILMTEVRKSRIDISTADMAQIFDSVPHAAHAKYYAKVVSDSYHRRRLATLGSSIAARSSDPTNSVSEMVAEIEGTIESIDSANEDYSISAEQAAENYCEQLFNSTETDSIGVPTGLLDMDCEMGGLMPGEMTVLAARPGCGKTSLAMQVAEYSAARGRHVLFASLEMGESELVQRSISSRTGVPSRDLRARSISEPFERAVRDSIIEIAALEMTFFVPPKATLRQVRAAARLQKSRTGLSMLVIDYLGLIRPDGRSQGKYEDVTLISNEIKSLARELRVPVMVLCQLNREAEGKTPMLSHLRDSGAIEQDADSVWFLEPHDWGASQKVGFNLIVAKSRHGRTFKTELKFEGNRTRFLPSNYNSEFSDFEDSRF
jgi:replicative DNA helicase